MSNLTTTKSLKTLEQMGEDALLAMRRRHGLPDHPPSDKGMNGERMTSIVDAIPYLGSEDKCPICHVQFTNDHWLDFFLDGAHYNQIIDILKYILETVNTMEATAIRLSTSDNPNLIHEPLILAKAMEIRKEGPEMFWWFLGTVGYFSSTYRELEVTKRGVKQQVSVMFIDIGNFARLLKMDMTEYTRLWGADARKKLGQFKWVEASAMLDGIRELILYAETLTLAEKLKVKELGHRDVTDILMRAAQNAGPQPSGGSQQASTGQGGGQKSAPQ